MKQAFLKELYMPYLEDLNTYSCDCDSVSIMSDLVRINHAGSCEVKDIFPSVLSTDNSSLYPER